jgi:guanyl-specific ribonuclease Sa
MVGLPGWMILPLSHIRASGNAAESHARLLSSLTVSPPGNRMRQLKPLLALAVLVLLALWWQHQRVAAPATGTPGAATQQAAPGMPAFLPPEARTTLALIARGGPFPHRQDGVVFENRERRLPQQPRGYYHEYTVDTPGLDYRGARRIITGGTPPVAYWYTDDHYRSFHRFEVTR